MVIFSKSSIGIAAGIAGSLFIGYCIYYDNKRRHDPDYKKNLRERRQAAAKVNESARMTAVNFNDTQTVESYFMQEVRLGEKNIAMKNFDMAVEHLANATMVCDDPSRLLDVLQQTLPPMVFTMLVEKIRHRQEIKMQQRAEKMAMQSASAQQRPLNQTVLMEDLE